MSDTRRGEGIRASGLPRAPVHTHRPTPAPSFASALSQAGAGVKSAPLQDAGTQHTSSTLNSSGEPVLVSGEKTPGQIDYRVQRNIARAAEFLVAADISGRGFDCFMAGEGLRYDLLADIGGIRRIQVKMNQRAILRAPTSVTTSYTFGKDHNPLNSYGGEIDLFAFVAMDRKVVIYMRPEQCTKRHVHIAASQFTEQASELSWCGVLAAWDLR